MRGIDALIRRETRIVFTESPGSLTFEMQDLPAIAEAAHARGCLVVMDNTWASPLYCKPFTLGADISIQAATKYIGGHSDLMMGIVTSTEAVHDRLRRGVMEVATAAAPDDCYLALRGLRTLAARLERHQRSALVVAEWLRTRPEVREVRYPALPDDPGHALWRRDFLGASGLFGIILEPCAKAAIAAMLDQLELFGMGWSWGGYESLLIPIRPETCRTATRMGRPGRADADPYRARGSGRPDPRPGGRLRPPQGCRVAPIRNSRLPAGPEQRARHDSQHSPAGQAAQPGSDLVADPLVQGRIAHDAALAHLPLADLELRLDQRHEPCRRLGQRQRRRQHQPSGMKLASHTTRSTGSGTCARREVTRVGPLQHDHARI